MQRTVILLALAVSAAGCMTTKAQTPIERPALEVPPVPARVIEPAPAPEVARIEPVPDLETASSADPPPPPRPRQPAPATRETQKPEPKPEASAPDVEAAPSTQPGSPVPQLRTPATADAAAAERQILETVARARKSLDSVHYQRLNEQRQKAYEEAKDFIVGAEREVKASNFELAKELADKADKVATALLQGR